MRIALAALCFILMTAASAQEWPTKPVRIIVPFTPGGVADNSARVVAEPLAARLGQQVIVDNRPGASGNIGTQAVAQADVGGHTLLLVFTAIATAQQYVRTNRLVGLGVPGAKRSSALHEVPTFQESGLAGFDVSSWVGIFAPAKTPQPVVNKLQRELLAALRTPFVRERYATLGIEPVGNSPREFFEQVRTDLARWAEVVKAANVKVE